MKKTVFLCLVLFGCQSSQPPSVQIPDPLSGDFQTLGEKGLTASEQVALEAEKITKEARKGQKEAPERPEWSPILDSASNLKLSNNKASDSFTEIVELTYKLEESEKVAGNLAGENADLRETIEKMKKSSTRTLMLAAITISVGGLALGIGLFFVPGFGRFALPVIAVSIGTGAVAKILVDHPWILTVAGFAIVGCVVWALISERKVMKELVSFGQWTKNLTTWGDRESRQAAATQSKETQKVVKAVKKQKPSSTS